MKAPTFHDHNLLHDIAGKVGTPAYIYSADVLRNRIKEFNSAFSGYPTTLCFAVKSLSNLSILKMIFSDGFGADIVSGGELERAITAGVSPSKVVFSGVGKQPEEISKALDYGIRMFNVESPWEIEVIAEIARSKKVKARIALRINPNIDAQTNAKISTGLYSTKFGLPETELPELLAAIKSHPELQLTGLACHIGSQITDIKPLAAAAEKMAHLAISVREQGFPLQYLDLGGGLGIQYHNENPPSIAAYSEPLIRAAKRANLELIIEPGRALVGNTGILLTKVVGIKKTPSKHFIVVDAAMNDLIRPTLYGSYHEISAVTSSSSNDKVVCDFVGPICETGDFIAQDRSVCLPEVGGLYAIESCGAYGSAMASHYNSRPKAAEVLVEGASYRIIRKREELRDIWAAELSELK